MSQQLYSFFLIIAFVRLYVLKISSKHANQLLREGEIEYGKSTTKWLAILGKYWSVKLIFEPDHQLIEHWLFQWVKHPNYFLNILPELIGVVLLFHAYVTLIIFILPYSLCLYLRIKKENQLVASIKQKEIKQS